MNFPERTRQHKAQSDSFAILLYRLKDLGIFRNITENDYGIDFEIEITSEEIGVTGKYFKTQVKSLDKVNIRKDKTPTIGGIKQRTLWYWTELSFNTHVIVFAVDLETEKIYWTDSIFWQATCLIDKSDSSKTIEFLRPIEFQDAKSLKEFKRNQKKENLISTILIREKAIESSIYEIVFAHKMLLRNIKEIFDLYQSAWDYDTFIEVKSSFFLNTFLECSKILIKSLNGPIQSFDDDLGDLDSVGRENLFNSEYWSMGGDWQTPLKIIIPLLLDRLQHYSSLVLKAKYYWSQKDLPYLKLVHRVVIPKKRKHKNFLRIANSIFDFSNKQSFDNFLKLK